MANNSAIGALATGLQTYTALDGDLTNITFTPVTSWTPTLQINNSTAGITYTTQVGQYTQIGSVVTFNFIIILSSKGASVGSVTMNVPVIPGINGNQNRFNIMFDTVTLTANYTGISLNLGNASLTTQLIQFGSGEAVTDLTNTEVADTSTFWGTGSYIIG